MNTRRYSIVPPASFKNEVRVSGTVVVCKGGAVAGARIHFADPSAQGFAGEASEFLVNGEAYLAPQDGFERFWITWADPLPTSRENLELVVIDCAQPVVVLNAARKPGFRCHPVGGAIVVEILANTTLYQDVAPGNAVFGNSQLYAYVERGAIGGGVRADQAYTATFYERLDPSSSIYWGELMRFEVGVADALGKFSCSFEHGGRTAFQIAGSGIRNGPILMPWPAFGLRLDIVPTTGVPLSIGDVRWTLYERAEG